MSSSDSSAMRFREVNDLRNCYPCQVLSVYFKDYKYWEGLSSIILVCKLCNMLPGSSDGTQSFLFSKYLLEVQVFQSFLTFVEIKLWLILWVFLCFPCVSGKAHAST